MFRFSGVFFFISLFGICFKAKRYVVMLSKLKTSCFNDFLSGSISYKYKTLPCKYESVGPVLSGHQLGNRVKYFGLYQDTRVVLYLLYTQSEISLNYSIIA